MQPILQLLYCSIHEQAEKTPDALAILAPGRLPISYRQLSGQLESVALHLNRLGFRRGDRVAVVLPNGPEMATAYLASSSVCTCAPLNPAYQVDEFTFSMKDLQVKALVTSFEANHPARQVAANLGIPVLYLKPDAKYAGLFSFFSSLPVDDSFSEPVLARMEDSAIVLHTSGTTSRPKIVPLTHRNVFYSAHNIVDTYSLITSDCCLNMMPLFHIHGLMGSLTASLMAGASVICAPGFTPNQVMGWLSDLGPTWYTAVPTIHQAILDQVQRHPGKVQTRLRFIRSCSSSLPLQVGRNLEITFAVPVLEAYGMTEATHQMASNPLPPKVHKFGSVGLPTGTTNISILDKKGNILPKNTLGEICICGENVMLGYENNPAANIASFTGGWLRTGDQGVIDDDGYLFIQGRLKELINRGGEKISPREIDGVLLTHPAVKQAVAFAVPHPTLGEDVAVAIVLHEGCIVSTQELRQFAASYLVDFKVPRQIIFVTEIPKGPTGKVHRIGLSEKLKRELEACKSDEPDRSSVPLTPLETDLLTIWQRELERQDIGIQDDFLAMGGDSIKAANILMGVEDRFNVNLSLRDIFLTPTISSMAALILKRQSKDK
ncbi:MAG: AMP-binding protein [Anaerolineales bacterium]|jgi:acyl-CoA synthetase (AMP-forming)/AMP-acid ligase II/acyl carrier protein